ncbi:MAG TPA: Maf family protein [Gaiellaceae bacterium]|jgi:septum formation protein
MLARLAGRTHEVISGFCLVGSGWDELGDEVTRVTFRVLGAGEIGAYLATGEWREQAGAYAIQGIGARLVEKIEGD